MAEEKSARGSIIIQEGLIKDEFRGESALVRYVWKDRTLAGSVAKNATYEQILNLYQKLDVGQMVEVVYRGVNMLPAGLGGALNRRVEREGSKLNLYTMQELNELLVYGGDKRFEQEAIHQLTAKLLREHGLPPSLFNIRENGTCVVSLPDGTVQKLSPQVLGELRKGLAALCSSRGCTLKTRTISDEEAAQSELQVKYELCISSPGTSIFTKPSD